MPFLLKPMYNVYKNVGEAFIISKITAGIISIVLAAWLYEREAKECNFNESGGIYYES